MRAEEERETGPTRINEADMEGLLRSALEMLAEEMAADKDPEALPRLRVASFAETGVLTRNAGLVVRIGTDTFQISIVRGGGA